MKKNSYSLVIYKDSAIPQHFEIPKSYVKSFFIGLPLLAIVALAFSIGGATYFKQIRLMIEKREPAIIKKLRDSKVNLEQKVTEQEILIKSLTTKMANPPITNLHLNLFAPPLGMQDMTASPGLNIENLEFQNDNKNIQIKFNIVNMSVSGKRLSGYIFIVLRVGEKFIIYPKENLNFSEHVLKFNQGESFAASRFRPVKVDFKNVRTSAKNFLFRIIIFSRSGDLLFSKIITPES